MPVQYRQPLMLRIAIVAAAAFACLHATAADLRLTGFGTVGYAISDRDFTYLRYIDNRGTFKVDSLVGVQAELQFNPQWSMTTQAVASAPRTRDDGMEAKIRWAFVSFRPTNDWLIRVGRVRPPVFLNTQNAEVGVTYDQARLPAELYTVSPVYDTDGIAINKSWSLRLGAEINAEAYWGRTNIVFRDHYQRDPPASKFPERIDIAGAVFTYQAGPLLLRTGAHYAKLTATGSELFPGDFDAVPIDAPPPFGGTVYAPSDFRREVSLRVLTLGADYRFGAWRVTSEYVQREVPEGVLIVHDRSAYATLAREINRWTAYVTYARLLSSASGRRAFRQIYDTPVPLAAQGPPLSVPENFHHLFGDRINVSDQYSVMLGASYNFSATSKFKLEWMRTKVGLVSNLVDGEARDKSANIVSLSYSTVF
jgi:hypothetical protein